VERDSKSRTLRFFSSLSPSGERAAVRAETPVSGDEARAE